MLRGLYYILWFLTDDNTKMCPQYCSVLYIYITYFAYACVIPNFVDPFSASPDWTAITIGQVEITNGTKYGGWFKNPTNLTGMMMRDQGDAFC